MRVFRAREKALKVLGGNPDDAFRILPKYKQVIGNSNHGNVVELDSESDPDQEEEDVIAGNVVERLQLFRRFFVGLAGLKKEFLAGCAPFIFFDGCHLRGKYGGVLLSAMGTDPDCGIFPVAYAVVETENKESWGFFLKCLEKFIGPFDDGKPWNFMTDRQKVYSLH
ncbi:hypothetical protein OROMI_015552 [Orobanche minor]